MAASDLAAVYEQLAELTAQELECARARRLAEVVDVAAMQQALLARLPSVPPAGAAGALRRCHDLRAQIDAELSHAREEMLAALAAVRRGQRAASGYAPSRDAGSLVHTTA